MPNQTEQFQLFAGRKIAEILEAEDRNDIYQLLHSKMPSSVIFSKQIFDSEYVSFRLALGCLAWRKACFENNIKEESIQKIFVRSALQIFEAPKSLSQASAFSEYLYSEDGIQLNEEVVLLAERFLKRIAVSSKALKSQVEIQSLSVYLKTMVAIAESIRMSFQSEFLEVCSF